MAYKTGRRPVKARVLAGEWERSERTIRRVWAEPRAEFEGRAQDRQRSAVVLRDEGLTYAQIGVRLGITPDAAAGLVRRARRNGVHSVMDVGV